MTVLIREDTGTHAVVRVIDPDAPVSAPYSRAVGLLERWVADERRAVDELAAWIEGQAAQAHAEMRLLCDELGLPVAWAEVPDQPVSLKPTELSPEQLNREYALSNMVSLARRGWTPDAGAARQARQVPALHPHNTSPGLPDEQLTPTERRSWSAEWAAFRADVKDMWRDLRRSLTWWRTTEED